MESLSLACHTVAVQQPYPPLTDAYSLFQKGREAEALKIVEHHAAAKDPEAVFTLGDTTVLEQAVSVGERREALLHANCMATGASAFHI